MPETYGVEVQFVCGSRAALYASTSDGQSFASCIKAGVDQANKRAETEGRKASDIQKLRSQLEQAQQDLEVAMKAADKAAENEHDALQAKADEKGSIVHGMEVELAKLLTERPLTLEDYDKEIVVRADFTPLSASVCSFYKDSAMDEVPPPPEIDDTPEGASDAMEAHAYRMKKNAQMKHAVMQKAKGCTRTSAATAHKGKSPSAGSILGAYKGGGVPPLTRKEVILSPLDVLPWLPTASV